MSDDELTPEDQLTPEDEPSAEEEKAFAGLPKERRPHRRLEERTVRALHAQGVLQRRPGFELHLTPARVAAVAAAAIVLVVGSFAFGQWSGTRLATRAIPMVPEENGMELAAFIQRAGSLYVAGLSELNESAGGGDPFAVQQGREAAVATLYAASGELLTLVPDEPVARKIMSAMDEVRRSGATDEQDGEVVWF